MTLHECAAARVYALVFLMLEQLLFAHLSLPVTEHALPVSLLCIPGPICQGYSRETANTQCLHHVDINTVFIIHTHRVLFLIALEC